MDILIIKSSDKATLKYDLFGNVFLSSNDRIYYVSIDSQNNPELMLVNQHKLTNLAEYDIDFTMGKLHSGVPSLKGFIEDELTRKKEDVENDEDDENVNDDYFPEQKYFYREGGDIDDGENDYMSSIDIEPMFKFFNHSNDFVTTKGYPSNSLYSFLVVNGNVTSKNIVLLSEEYNDTCSYRITFYTDGNIKCNVVGSREKMYTLVQNDDKQLDIIPWLK